MEKKIIKVKYGHAYTNFKLLMRYAKYLHTYR